MTGHPVQQVDIAANGITFSALSTGPTDGPLALCLHGFPDSAHTWRFLLPELAAAGFRAVAPWMRGYAPTDVPADGDYSVGALAADACTLHEALAGDEHAVLIGQDWGAFAAYAAAAFAPDCWRRLVTLAVPHPGAIGPKLFAYEQLKRSFYVFVFQAPVAEMAVALDDLTFVDGLWGDWSPGFDAADNIAAAKDALQDPTNLSAALGYYRAMLGTTEPSPRFAAQTAAASRIAPQPALYLHGDRDGSTTDPIYADAAAFLSTGLRIEVVDGTGHFPHVEEPDIVNALIVDWITRRSDDQ